MEKQPVPIQRLYAGFLALAGWFALAGQAFINLNSNLASLPEIIIRYVSYFTLLTNGLVAVCCTILALRPGSRRGLFFSRPGTLTAVTLYITVVGIVYNVVLRFLWNPDGFQRMVDELLHTVIPFLFILYWLLYTPKGGLKWKMIWPWMIYPLVYAAFILVRGSLSGFYPYPFLDISRLGMDQVALNMAGVTGVFFLCSLLFVGAGKLLSLKQTRAAQTKRAAP
jgi:hypothetical protein